MKDEDIIRELRKGNEHYLKHLYRHLDMVKSWVLKNNGGEHEALDLFQEAMIVFYRNVMSGKYEHKAKISTYLFEICRRQWLNYLNRKAHREVPKEDMSSLDGQVQPEEVEIGKPGKNLKQYLESALEQLGEPCKSLIEATVFLKRKFEEVAREFDYKDAHSARQAKLRCLNRLRGKVSYDVVLQLA